VTYSEIKASCSDMLTAAEVADVVGASPITIRAQAHECPEKLGFPVVVLGNRVRIPRLAFIRFMEGQPCPEQ